MNRKLFRALCSMVTLASPLALQASFPQQIVVLGDSLSDSGNFPEFVLQGTDLIAKKGAPLTDGTTWAVWLADELKTDSWLLPSSQAGTNFAVAGAFSGNFVPSPIPSLITQTTQIVPQVDRDFPVFIWGGSNDFLELGQFTTISPLQPVVTATTLTEVVQNIHALGFDTQVVFNIPNLADVPDLKVPPFSVFNPDINVIEGYVQQTNALFAQNLAALDYPVLGIDIQALMNDVVANPAEYGFTNVTNATPAVQVDILGNIVAPGSPTDGYLFYYDGVHPTHKAQRTIADYVYTTLVAPSFFGNLSQQTFSVSREIMTNIRQQSFAVQPCHDCGVFYPFISGSYEPLLDGPSNPHVHDYDAIGGDVTYGVSYDFSHNWRIGLAGSYARHYFENGQHLSKFKSYLTTNAATIFGGYQDCNGYVDAAFTTSWHNFDKLKRIFTTGFATHEAHGSTTGIDYHGQLTGAYLAFHPTDNISTGPMIDFNYQWVSIDGYHEKNARIENIQYKDYNNDIFTTGLGWEFRYCFDYQCCCECINFFADAYIMANRQWFGKTERIKFRQISFGENFGAWPVVIAKRNNYVSGGLSLTANVCERALVNFGYNFNVGNLSMSEHVITIGLTAPFCF